MISRRVEKLFPRAPLKIIAMEGCKELGQKVNDYIVNFRQSSYREELKSPMYATYLQDNYLVDAHCPRFGSGEAKGMILNESVRGYDLLHHDRCMQLQPDLQTLSTDHVNHMSPDDHYQDLKRLIAAANGKARPNQQLSCHSCMRAVSTDVPQRESHGLCTWHFRS